LPSEKILEQKKAIVAELTEKIANAKTGVVVDYKGITVEADTQLRKKLREAGVEYKVVKNTFLRFALNSNNLNELDEKLEGTTAIALWSDDTFEGAKLLSKQAESGSFAIKGGFMDGKVISVDTVNALAKLPPREVLIAQVLAGFNAPVAAFARVLNAIVEKQSA
jgi:large subunit ribosomal protein L10